MKGTSNVSAVTIAGLITCVLFAACLDADEPTVSTAPSYEFVNGRWFDGASFESKTVYAVDGVIRSRRPARVDSTIDLVGGYVVPPYGEAHTHLLSDPETLSDQIGMYLEDGVFYVMNQDPLRVVEPDVLRRVNTAQSVDVVFPEGVITPSWSIVAKLYEQLAESGQFGPGVTLDSLDGSVIHLIDDREDLQTSWNRIAGMNDDVIKVIVAFSEDHDARTEPDRSAYELGRFSRLAGLDPDLLDEIVRRAHGDGLRVSVHIETAADFRLAVRSGADYVAHLPASWQIGSVTGLPADDLTPWMLTSGDAAAAAAAGVTVITTAFTSEDHPDTDRFATVHRHNLIQLRDAGVKLAIGSDRFDDTSLAEIRYLAGLDVFTNTELLVMLSQQTPRAIFPERNVGGLEDGMEASFLVLGDNPLSDPDHLEDIRYSFKDGQFITLSDTAEAAYEMTSVTEDVHLMQVPDQFMYDNVVVLSNEAGVLLVDTGFMETMASQDRALAGLTDNPVSVVINTHFHHAGGNPAYAASATILAHERTRVRLSDDAVMYDLVPLEALPERALPDSTFTHSLTIRHGDERIEARHFPGAHTDGDVVVFFRRSNVVATGDLFVTGLGACDYANGCRWQQYVNGIGRLLVEVPEDAIVVPGHGRIGTYHDIRDYHRFLLDITMRIQRHISSGGALESLLESGLPEEWRHLEEGGLPAEFFLTNAYRALSVD